MKYISLEFQGEYSLLLTSITVLMLFTGFDFYVYSNRYLIKNREEKHKVLINQFIFHFCTYLLLFLLFIILTLFNVPFQYLTIAVFFLLIFEHLGMEFFRIFIALEKPLIANIVLFIRTGTWPLLLIYKVLVVNESITIQTIIYYWTAASILSVILSFAFIFKDIYGVKISINKIWIKQGLKVASIFFIATVAQKIIEYSDRYIIDSFLGIKSVGIYSFYFQLANVANVVIFTIFISFMYPQIIYFIDKKLKKEAYQVIRKLQLYSIGFIVIYTISIAFLLPYLLDFIGKNELYNHQIILYLFLIGNLFLNLSYTSHYVLLSLEKDKVLMWIVIGIAIVNLIGNLIVVNLFGLKGVVSVFVISSILLFVIKLKAEKKYLKKYEWK